MVRMRSSLPERRRSPLAAVGREQPSQATDLDDRDQSEAASVAALTAMQRVQPFTFAELNARKPLHQVPHQSRIGPKFEEDMEGP